MAPDIILELPWIMSVIVIAAFVLMVALCVCSKQHEKVQEYGTAGRLSITRNSPLIQHQPRNGDVIPLKATESDLSPEEGSYKRNSWTVKDRALPDIPATRMVTLAVDEMLDNAESNNVPATVEINHNKRKSHNKPLAPRPPSSELPTKDPPSNSSSSPTPPVSVSDDPPCVTVTITVGNKTRPSEVSTAIHTPGFNTGPLSEISENLPGTSDGTVMLKKIEKVESTKNTSYKSLDSEVYDSNSTTEKYITSDAQTAPTHSYSPVCIRIGVPHGDNATAENASVTTASLAVAGAVPSSDIPYMTPPLLHNPPVSLTVGREQASSSSSNGVQGEVPYTVISVREPLARVREQTLQRQKIASELQNSEESEDHYAMVPEEEQMYAEIGSGQDSASSSVTYAHIEPRELPPVPPTVESLKSVAHAHSRQASTVSTSSFGSCVSSSGEPTSPPQLRNPTPSLYSTIDKSGKQRKTIHIAEGAGLMSTVEKRKKVEDLYAKVRKKRAELTISTSGSEDYTGYQGLTGDDQIFDTPPPSPWASTTPPAPPPITGRLQAASLYVLYAGGSQHVNRRHSADPNISDSITETTTLDSDTHLSYNMQTAENEEPGYERIYNEQEDYSIDSCYEKIKDSESNQENIVYPEYESVQQAGTAQSDVNYPGYESVKDTIDDEDLLDPGYECVAQLSEIEPTDPGYEPVRISVDLDDSDSSHDYNLVKVDDEKDPGYETVKKLYRTESDAADPGYEKIRKIHRTESDATDPGYERVRHKMEEIVEPGYETVQRSDSDTDPGYEIVHHRKKSNADKFGYTENASSSSNYAAQANGKVAYQKLNSTVLFVSGNSDQSAKTVEMNETISKEPYRRSSGANESEATATAL